jgi:hypothetical protein
MPVVQGAVFIREKIEISSSRCHPCLHVIQVFVVIIPYAYTTCFVSLDICMKISDKLDYITRVVNAIVGIRLEFINVRLLKTPDTGNQR